MNLQELKYNFKKNRFQNEADIQLHFHSDLVKPILDEINPQGAGDYRSENRLTAGGRADATFREIQFEFKKEKYFDKKAGCEEALYGRKHGGDHGLYDYIISNAGLVPGEEKEKTEKKLMDGIGVGFDGNRFIFARFVPSTKRAALNTSKLDIETPCPLNVEFRSEMTDFDRGLKKLVFLLRQREQMTLNKHNVTQMVHPKNKFVRDSILSIYRCIDLHVNDINQINNRVRTLYREWDRVFGVMYGEDREATDFTEVSSKSRELYDIHENQNIDSKLYLFSMQTFFNIFLKLLVYSFLSQLIDPMFTVKQGLDKASIDRLFAGESFFGRQRLVDNFFEPHFLEWFIYTNHRPDGENLTFDEKIVNEVLQKISCFDLNTFLLKPETIQDILQEVYMGLIPAQLRHLMGEYFSPDWIVEHVLDMVGYEGDIDKKLMDPTAGSGPFLAQAIKRIVSEREWKIDKKDIEKITRNIVGFDINPISVVSAKTNYILIIFSAYYNNCNEYFGDAVSIPVFIADSILAPVVYTEENDEILRLETSVDKFEMPKFKDYKSGNEFLNKLSFYIEHKYAYENFYQQALGEQLIQEKDEKIVHKLFDSIYKYHMAGQDSFWPIIFKNSFAPVMIGDKFDYVVGNPPWIAWKAMSKSYRERTLSIWQSYGVFEKSAYDKKTTHDDFAMAVTYVAMDQYLKNKAAMVFLLPASFLKSTKGGEGFRKFSIVRNGQNVPFAVECVHDFSKVKLFTIATVAIAFRKSEKMVYPMAHYQIFEQLGGKTRIDTHASWQQVERMVKSHVVSAQPVDQKDRQSAWLTLENMKFANRLLDCAKERVYKGRKGIEPAGAKGVYILKQPRRDGEGYLEIVNDMSRSRRQDIQDKGEHSGRIEETHVYPMLGGRNIARWRVKSHEYMLVPHTGEHKYGIPEGELAQSAPKTYEWLLYYREELLETRKKNGKFFDEKRNPFYRLDNVGTYTYAPYKVLWKEQTGSMAAVVVGHYSESIPGADPELFSADKVIVVDSKVLMLDMYDKMEAHYVCGIINSPSVIRVIDGYAIATNRGVDVLKYLAIPKYDSASVLHSEIAARSVGLHENMRRDKVDAAKVLALEKELDECVCRLFL